jgi:SAM-dependent methyltransferase
MPASEVRRAGPHPDAGLPYFVEWRPGIWSPAVRWVIGDEARLAGKRVLEIGCRYGRMSCFFGLSGASVVGVDIRPEFLVAAREEASRWNVQSRVEFHAYDGNPRNLPGTGYDFVFTKSVLVIVPCLEDYLAEIRRRLAPGGELLMVENARPSRATEFVRRIVHRHEHAENTVFRGVDSAFVDEVRKSFPNVRSRRFLGLVVAMRASC